MKARKILVPVLMIVISCAVALGLVEITLRLIEPTSDIEVTRIVATEHGDYTTLRPDTNGLILGRPVTINSQGYRGELRPFRKAPGRIRILFFGDSHTFSMGADDDHTYPAITEDKLNDGSGTYEALNFGVLGQDLRQILMHIDRYALEYDPDVVVLTFHSGDLLESPYDVVKKSQKDQDLGLLYRLKRDSLQYSYVARLTVPFLAGILRNALGWNPGVTTTELREVEENGPVWSRLSADILQLKSRLDRQGVRLAFVLFPTMTAFENHPARPVHAALAAWLEGHGIPALDLLPYFEGQKASALTASLLDKHPNEKAYEITGSATSEFIAERVLPR